MEMTWNVICRVSHRDSFDVSGEQGVSKLVLPIDVPSDPRNLGTNVWDVIDDHALSPSQEAIDLLRLAAAVFSCDLRIPRDQAYDRWTRHIRLFFPVANAELWSQALDPLVSLLRFLSGDYWELKLREAKTNRPPVAKKRHRRATPLQTSAACLLSGGLDSFIGASDALAAGERMMFVSHHGGGSSIHASPAQDEIVKAFAKRYDRGNFRHLKFYLDPPKRELTGIFEPSTRSRSIIFLALGTLVASALSEPSRLVVPENGFISLNVPPTYSRLGSLSTRTTHPHTLDLFSAVLALLGIQVNAVNPYGFKTKGEMILEAQDRDFVSATAARTMSCAHPTAGRYQGYSVGHCGYCFPCIIRRAATHKAGISGEVYRKDPRTDTLGDQEMKDLRALEIAIEKAKDGVSVADVIKAGPLKRSPEALHQYIDVYRRGLNEIAAFLEG